MTTLGSAEPAASPIPTPAPTAPTQPAPAAAATATSGWSTYTNQAYGFSLQYPAGGQYPYNWSVDEQTFPHPNGDAVQGFKVVFATNNGLRYPETLSINNQGSDLASATSYYDAYYAQTPSVTVSKSATTVAGKSAVAYNYTSYGVPTRMYLVAIGNDTYVITSLHGDFNQNKFADFWGVFDGVANSLVTR